VKAVDVAAALLWDNSGRVLLGQRAAGTWYPGYWEFPGGKVEAGETPVAALVRELGEELAISLVGAQVAPWLTRRHHYPHAEVTLHFFQVWGWQGVPQPLVHAALSWERPGQCQVAPLLPANGPVMAALCWPQRMVVSNVAVASGGAAVGSLAWQEAADRFAARVANARRHGLVAAMIREAGGAAWDEADGWRARGVDRLVALARAAGAERVVVNGPLAWAEATGADGLHLPAARAMQLLAAGGPGAWRARLALGVSVHDRTERQVAEALGADYWVVGPVAATATHPGQPPLGWARFAALIAAPPVPVYAIGGLNERDLPRALAAGGHGVAAIRGWG